MAREASCLWPAYHGGRCREELRRAGVREGLVEATETLARLRLADRLAGYVGLGARSGPQGTMPRDFGL